MPMTAIHGTATRVMVIHDLATGNLATGNLTTGNLAIHDMAVRDMVTRDMVTRDIAPSLLPPDQPASGLLPRGSAPGDRDIHDMATPAPGTPWRIGRVS
jgi:hypothetical protein